MNIVVENIRAYCEAHGYTFAKFERLCDLSNGMIGKWELGYNKGPTVTTLKKISDATGIDMDAWLKEGGVNARQKHQSADDQKRSQTA